MCTSKHEVTADSQNRSAKRTILNDNHVIVVTAIRVNDNKRRQISYDKNIDSVNDNNLLCALLTFLNRQIRNKI